MSAYGRSYLGVFLSRIKNPSFAKRPKSMKIDIEKTSSADYISARIKSTILYPKVTKTKTKLCRDEEHDRGRERAFWAFYLNSLSDEEISKKATPHFVRFLNESGSLDSCNAAWNRCKKKIFTVFSLMRLVYSGTTNQNEPISLATAIAKYNAQVENELEAEPALREIFTEDVCEPLKKIRKTREKRVDRGSVRNHWRDLEEVAHLCAAWYAVRPGNAQSDQERHALLMDVLELAKGLYDFGVKHVAPSSRGALLESETAWRISDDLGLEKIWDDSPFIIDPEDYESFVIAHLFEADPLAGLD